MKQPATFVVNDEGHFEIRDPVGLLDAISWLNANNPGKHCDIAPHPSQPCVFLPLVMPNPITTIWEHEGRVLVVCPDELDRNA